MLSLTKTLTSADMSWDLIKLNMKQPTIVTIAIGAVLNFHSPKLTLIIWVI